MTKALCTKERDSVKVLFWEGSSGREKGSEGLGGDETGGKEIS